MHKLNDTNNSLPSNQQKEITRIKLSEWSRIPFLSIIELP